MYYETLKTDSYMEILFGDRITSKDSDEFNDLLDNFIHSDFKTIVFNYSKTIYMDSAALGFLLLARSYMGKNNKKMIIKHPSNNVMKMLELLNFVNIFNIKLQE